MFYDTIRQKSTEQIKSLHWQITDICNYKCNYCSERQYDKNRFHYGLSDQKTISKVLETILNLPGSWQIKFGNGEPTNHPKFLEICEEITRSRHTLCLTTNFSAPREMLKKFVEICGEKLNFVTASLHLGQTNVDEFLQKAIWFDSIKDPQTCFIVTNVVTDENFIKIKHIYKELEENGIRLELQIRKSNERTVMYSQKTEEYIANKLHGNQRFIRDNSFFGKECYTGNLFFIIDPIGNVFRCYQMITGGYLGNMVKGTFARYPGSLPCLSLKCECVNAIERNLILFKKKRNIGRITRHLAKSIKADRMVLKKLLESLSISI